MARFQYNARSNAEWEKRATASRFVNYYKDEFKNFALKKENWVRILPPTWENPKHFGFDLWLHYGVGPDNGCVVCLYKMLNKACPICEAQARAEAAGQEEAAKKLKPTRRVLVWVLDRKDEATGPQLWAMPWTGDRDLAIICKDRQTGELFQIDHPDAGFDVTFDRTGELPNVKYVGWQIARRTSSVDDKHLEYVLAHPIPSTIQWRTYEEVSSLFDGQPITGAVQKQEQVQQHQHVQAEPERPVLQPVIEVQRAQLSTGFCNNTIKFRGELLGCAAQNGHAGECDFARDMAHVTAPTSVSQEPCEKTFTFKGNLFGCSGVSGHAGDCQFDVELGPVNGSSTQAAQEEKAPPAGLFDAPQPQAQVIVRTPVTTEPAAQPTALSSRAAAIRSRFQTGS